MPPAKVATKTIMRHQILIRIKPFALKFGPSLELPDGLPPSARTNGIKPQLTKNTTARVTVPTSMASESRLWWISFGCEWQWKLWVRLNKIEPQICTTSLYFFSLWLRKNPNAVLQISTPFRWLERWNRNSREANPGKRSPSLTAIDEIGSKPS